MKKWVPIPAVLLISAGLTTGQVNRCASHDLLQKDIQTNPSIHDRALQMEYEMSQWIKGHQLYAADRGQETGVSKIQAKGASGNCSPTVCTYNNVFHESVTAPDSLGMIVTPVNNCVQGGKFVRLTGMLLGNIYRISTCNGPGFNDTQITIFKTGEPGNPVAYNDDACGTRSEIFFNPVQSVDYDVLIDEFQCSNSTLCVGLEIELVYIPRDVVRIPVVVHVIHKGENVGTGTNISNTQILSQINVLNQDFRRLNAAINNIPAAFRGLSDDPLIEFCLTSEDTASNPVSGIVRYNDSTSKSISEINNTIKPATIWDPTRFLNIWSVHFGPPDGNTLGYATFPWNGTPTTDGLVLSYNAFGNTGTVVPPFHLGKTATHEVGHWLGLYHIWGDITSCNGSDSVADTPNQAGPTFGTANFPKCDNCSVSYPGTMFYNYMDYSNDVLLSMFTRGQVQRMDAVLATQRPSFLNSAICPPTGIRTKAASNKFSIYPNPNDGGFEISLHGVSADKTIQIKISEPTGKIVWEGVQTATKTIKLQINGLAEGAYILLLNDGSSSSYTKLIIKR